MKISKAAKKHLKQISHKKAQKALDVHFCG
jgi:hypothetical protein